MQKPRLVLFDGNALIHRAYHALPPLSVRKTGELVGAVFGFAQILLKALNDLQPTHYAIAFDRAAPTFRHLMYDQYKATRKETPEDLRGQFGRVKELVAALNMPIYELAGFEADDVLGALSKQASDQGMDTVIVSGDADTMQLVNDKVKVFYPRPRGTFSDADLYDAEAVLAKYGIKPEHIQDYKALKGDPSDNIHGVPGIGEKTAVKLIQQFGSLEEIYEHINEVQPPRVQAILREHETEGRRSKILATIVTEAPVQLDLKAAEAGQFDRDRVVELLRELEFVSLIQKLPGSAEAATSSATPAHPPSTPPVTRNYSIISTEAQLDDLARKLSAASSFSFDTETDGPNPMRANLVGISVSVSPGEACYIPLAHTGLSSVNQLLLQSVAASLGPLLANAALPKNAHNGKFDVIVLAENGIEVAGLTFDTSIAAYLLCEGALDLKPLAFEKLKVEMMPITDLIGKGAKQTPMSQVEIERAAEYACADADITGQLSAVLGEQLKRDNLWQLFDEVEMPLLPVLVHMERAGVLLDGKLLANMSRELGEQILRLEREIYLDVGHQFNINSTQQLAVILFEELKLPGSRKRGGGYTTSADKLEVLRGVHPIIDHILEYRQVTKLKSTYVDALPGLVLARTGRVHTSFNQTRTTTGRLSSSDPNLQNIPIRGEQGKLIRSAFIAPEGSYLLSADYSQIDLRSLAHLSQDESLLGAFRRDEDIHAATAAQLFGVPRDQVTGAMRRLAKTVNFGVIYGMSEFGLQAATELSREEAGKFIAAYFEKYPGVKTYLEETKQHARKKGYVQTLLGRKRLIPEINAGNRMLREGAERMAINMPVQGTSADIIKKAMVDIYAAMMERGLKSRMLLQVHDELVFEVLRTEVEEMSTLVKHLMEQAIKLDVPLKVDCKVGKNWGEMDK